MSAIHVAEAFALDSEAVDYRNGVFVALATGHLYEMCTLGYVTGIGAFVNDKISDRVQRDCAHVYIRFAFGGYTKCVGLRPFERSDDLHVFVHGRVIVFRSADHVALVIGLDRNDVAWLRECVAHAFDPFTNA